MVRYVKCPRCELNYIDGETQEYCDVCIAEIKGNRLQFADLEEDFVDEMEDEKAEICPICGVNSISYGESMCDSCKKATQYDVEDDIDIEEDEEWKNYLDEETEDLTIDDEALEEEFGDEFDDEEEEFEDEMYEDDFEEDFDSIDDYDEGDYDDDDEDDDDDDDF
ncbi:MAG: hypothetical protein E7370_03215 [Clostridiales bacterium]|nr:hypothetical protein [Clostridiales bacterium]